MTAVCLAAVTATPPTKINYTNISVAQSMVLEPEETVRRPVTVVLDRGTFLRNASLTVTAQSGLCVKTNRYDIGVLRHGQSFNTTVTVTGETSGSHYLRFTVTGMIDPGENRTGYTITERDVATVTVQEQGIWAAIVRFVNGVFSPQNREAATGTQALTDNPCLRSPLR